MMNVIDWVHGLLYGNESDEEYTTEQKVEEETRELMKRYTEKRAEITFPNGESEAINYASSDTSGETVEFYTFDPEDFNVGRRTHRYATPTLYIYVNKRQPRLFSLANIRDIKVRRERDMVAVKEVNVEVTYSRDSEDEEWDAVNTRITDDGPTPSVTFWTNAEWQEHLERQT